MANLGGLVFSKMEPQSMRSDRHTAGRSDFLRRLRDNKGYKRLLPILGVENCRLDRFEEACWRFHSKAARHEIKGLPAKRALSHLQRLRCALGEDLSWMDDSVAQCLESLRAELETLASRTQRGRPNDPVKSFLRNMQNFIPPPVPLRAKRSVPYRKNKLTIT